jgi:hypothetical protein
MPPDRFLLTTSTREPFQPIRLAYSIPDRRHVLDRLRDVRCVVGPDTRGSWQWLFEDEAAGLTFFGGYGDVPEALRPVILAWLRFPNAGGMTLETNSIPRAIEAARFFAPRLGPEVVLRRARIVNRLFAATDGHPEELLKNLDRNVTVVDPRQAEEDFARSFEGVRTPQEAEAASRRSLDRRLASGKDVPPVEDFPLAPEEETPDFQHLAATVQFRLIRALEHWKGNTHLTLTAIILRAVEQAQKQRGG